MAITRPFGYNPSQNPIPGADSYGTLVVGSDNLDFSQNPGGIKWWMGPDETDGYVIGTVVSGGTQPSPVGDIGTVQFWRSANLTTNNFISLVNKISLQNFTNVGDAITWLNANGYWTSYDTNNPTPTPSTTSVIMVTPTPTVTSTPAVTVTPSQTLPEPYLLDTYSGAVVAYSLRKLSSTYTGAAIRVRRSSDNAEQDIGFLNNGLDTMALSSFVGSANGFVSAWYDQSGNGVNSTQPYVIGTQGTTQPQIVTSGVTILQNGKPTLLFSGAGMTTISSFVRKPQTIFFVSRPTNVSYTSNVYLSGPSGTMELRANSSGKIEFLSTYISLIGTSTNSVNTNFSIFSFKLTSGGQFDFFLNNTNLGGGGTTGQSFPNSIMSLHQEVNSYQGLSNTSEVIIFGSDQSSNRTNINGNINSYYTIF